MTRSIAAIRDERRVASDTIRGFLAQVLLCAQRWIALAPGEFLVVEGNEDIDIHTIENGVLTAATEESVKELAGRLTARDEAVYQTLANFARAFEQYDRAGTPCTLAFTTTAGVGSQRLAARVEQRTAAQVGPTLPFDILKEWARWRRGEADAQEPEIIFDAVELVIRAHLAPESGSDLDTALTWIRGGERRAAFIRSIQWNFNSSNAASLQDQLLLRLTVIEGGNADRASAVAERLLAHIWRASATSEVAARTLTAELLRELRDDVARTHAQWEAWQRMVNFTSWVSWNADHLSVAVVEDGSRWSATAVGVCFVSAEDEGRLARALTLCRDDIAVQPAARVLLRQGEYVAAAWADSTVGVRLLDALRATSLQFYVSVAGRAAQPSDIASTLAVRGQRRDRSTVDLVLNRRADELAPAAATPGLARPGVLAITELVAAAVGRWLVTGDLQATRLLPWVQPKIKLLRDTSGERHRRDSAIWTDLLQSWSLSASSSPADEVRS
jgi:hypothetical protein